VDKALKVKAKAAIYVSLNGRCGDIEKLKGKFPIVEDACQSLGSCYHGKPVGTIGDIGVYSLSPHKIISTSQGGLVVTNDRKLHNRIEQLKDFGRLSGGVDFHPAFGINCKFTDFQAVVGIEQLDGK
jgi:perosamine synthetase